MKYALFAVAALVATASGAGAVTVTITIDRLAGEAYGLDPTQFASLSTFFEPHGSVTTSLGAPAEGGTIVKNLADAVPDGRYNPDGRTSWIDSADTNCCVGM